MNALKDAVAAAFDNVVASGAIEAAIEKHVAAAVTSAINEQLTSYGEFGKALKAKVSTLIEVNLDEIDLPSYRDLVGKIIRQRVGTVMTEQFTTQLDKDMCELLSPAPASITLDALLEEFVKVQLDSYRGDELRGNRFTLVIDRDKNPTLLSSGYVDIYLDPDEGTEKYRCAIHIRCKGDGEVWSLELGGTEIKNKIFVGPMFGFEKRLFQMYTAKTKLTMAADDTEHDFETRFPHHGED